MFQNLSIIEIIIAYIIVIYSLAVTVALFHITRKYFITSKELTKQNLKHSRLTEIENFINRSYAHDGDYLLDKELELIKKFRSLTKSEKEKIVQDINDLCE